METKDVISEMMTENTGRHFLDSGGAYGRNWERNQTRDFSKEEPSELSFKYGEIDVTHNLYHWLNEMLSCDEEMDNKFQAFSELEENEERGWLELMEEFPKTLEGEVGGIYGEGNPIIDNSYNSDNLLSQTIQFLFFDYNDEEYVILQIHGGCDVRGGYTRPRVFTTNSELSIFDYARGAISCTNSECEAYWTTDDGCHWYHEGTCGLNAGTQLEDYERIELEEGDGPIKGRLCHTKEGKGYCPFCKSELKAYFY